LALYKTHDDCDYDINLNIFEIQNLIKSIFNDKDITKEFFIYIKTNKFYEIIGTIVDIIDNNQLSQHAKILYENVQLPKHMIDQIDYLLVMGHFEEIN
jgi:hypothetical protein